MIAIKKLTVISVFLMLLFFMNINAYANVGEYATEWYEASGAKELSEALSDDTKEYLEKIGCEDAGIEEIFDISFESVINLIKDMISKGVSEPLGCVLKITGVVLLISVCTGFFPDDEKSKTVLNLISGSFLIVEIFVPAVECVKAASSAIGACAAFEKALIPVLAAVVTVSGNPSSALSLQGVVFAAAQFAESFAAETVVPLVGVCGALNITGAILPTLRLSAVAETIRKTTITLLSSVAGLFTGLLSVKSVLAKNIDAMAMRGVKLAAGTFIPVVGGALGEAYSAVTGSLSLIKETVGIYAVIVIFAIALPAIISLALWVIALRIACMVSDLLDCRQCSEIIKSISFVFSMVNTLLLLCTAVFVISTGLVVFIKNG